MLGGGADPPAQLPPPALLSPNPSRISTRESPPCPAAPALACPSTRRLLQGTTKSPGRGWEKRGVQPKTIVMKQLTAQR